MALNLKSAKEFEDDVVEVKVEEVQSTISFNDSLSINENVPATQEDNSVLDKNRIYSISDKLDPMNPNNVLEFGLETQRDITAFTDTVLNETKSSDIDIVGEKVLDIVDKVKTLDVSNLNSSNNFLSSIPLFGGMFDKISKTKQKFESISSHIDSVTAELKEAKVKLLDKVDLLETLYEKNTNQYNELSYFIEAGEYKLKQMNNFLPSLVEESQNDGLKAQQVQDFKQAINRLEKKVQDLKLVRMSALQTNPQIRIIQANNVTLAEKIQGTINLTIPLWKKQFMMALALNEQQKAAELQTAVSDATNDFLRANAEMLKDNSLSIAEENERGIIDIETLEHVQDTLLSTLTETLNIQKEGKQKRVEAAKKLEELESNLTSTLRE